VATIRNVAENFDAGRDHRVIKRVSPDQLISHALSAPSASVKGSNRLVFCIVYNYFLETSRKPAASIGVSG
jgi:hypothetical protein